MLGFFNFFGKEQLSVIGSRGVSLMPQLKTIKPAGPWSTVPYFTCFKGIICFKCNTYSYQLIFTRIFLKGQGQSSKSHWHYLYVTLKWNVTTCMLLVSLLPPSTAVVSLIHNGPSLMSTLVSACRWHHSYSCTGSLRETCSASLYHQLAQCNTNILLRT